MSVLTHDAERDIVGEGGLGGDAARVGVGVPAQVEFADY